MRHCGFCSRSPASAGAGVLAVGLMVVWCGRARVARLRRDGGGVRKSRHAGNAVHLSGAVLRFTG